VGVIQLPVTATFSRAIDTRTLTSSTLMLLDASNLAVPAAIGYDAAKRTATLTPTLPLAPLSTYTVRVAGGSLGIHDAQGVPLAADAAWTFRTAASASAPSAYFNFSEAAGTTAIDRSGNGNDAALLNGAAWTAGRIGGGLRFDGVDDAMQLPNSQTLAFSGAFTVEAWIAPATFDRERFFWWTPSAMMTLRADGTVVPVAVLTGGQVGFVSNWSVAAGVWSHVAITYDGATLRLYINGMDAGSRPASGTLIPSSPPQAALIGGSSGFAGLLDEVKFYRRSLSPAEISADMAVPPPSSPAPRIDAVDIIWTWLGPVVVVDGSNFGARQGTSTITINGIPATVLSWCSDTILALVPRSVTSGPVVVKVDGKTSNTVFATGYGKK